MTFPKGSAQCAGPKASQDLRNNRVGADDSQNFLNDFRVYRRIVDFQAETGLRTNSIGIQNQTELKD